MPATCPYAERNGVADHTTVAVSDLVDAVEGDLDLVVIDPPFRWFAPRTMLERAFTDEHYGTLTRFLDEVRGSLRPDGAVLWFFGTSGDVAYLDERIARAGWTARRSPSARSRCAAKRPRTSCAASRRPRRCR